MDRLVINGLNLSEMGIGDVDGDGMVVTDLRSVIKVELVSVLREIGLVGDEPDEDGDDEDWPFAE